MTDRSTASGVGAETMGSEKATRGETMSGISSRRLATVLLAPATALAAWGLFRAAGVAFDLSRGGGPVGAGDVVVAAAVASLLAWGVVRLLERHAQRPRLWWARIASTCFAASIAGPLWCADGASSVALLALHLVTAVVIVVGFVATLPRRRRASSYSATRRAGSAALR